MRGETEAAARKAIDASDTTLFGSTSGKTTAITYLAGASRRSPTCGRSATRRVSRVRWRRPEGIDFVIVRENLEDLYLGLEGPLEALAPLKLMSKILRAPLDTSNAASTRSK